MKKPRTVDIEDLNFATALIIFALGNFLVSLIAFIALVMMVRKGLKDIKEEENEQGNL